MTDAVPAPSVVIRGGAPPTAVDTVVVAAQALVVRTLADRLGDVAGRCRAARFSLAGLGPSHFAVGTPAAWGRSTLPTSPAAQPFPWWPAHVSHAKQAALDALDDLATRADDSGAQVRELGDRMQRAVTVYDDAALSAEQQVAALEFLMRGLGVRMSPLGPLVPWPLEPVVGLGVDGVTPAAADYVRGEGFSPGRVATETAAGHPAAVAWLSRWIGLFDVGWWQRPWAPPDVGNASSVLNGFTSSNRSRYLDDPQVTRLATPPALALPDSRDATTALDAVNVLYDKDSLPGSVVSVQRVDKGPGEAPAWVVAIPGTQSGAGNVFSMRSNFTLMDDDVGHRAEADSVKAVLAAMDDAGIRPGEDVLLVGHSQGGMVASVVAGATVGRYSVRHVVTAGSPVAGYELPKGVKGTHLETQGEGVSDLDAAENRATPERVTVTGEFRSTDGAPIDDVPHGVGFHQRVLAEATDVGDRGLEENLADVAEILSGDRGAPQLYEARLVEPPERCVAPMVLPTPLGPPPFLLPSAATAPFDPVPSGQVTNAGGLGR